MNLHILGWLPKLFCVGVMKMYISQVFLFGSVKKIMYCTNATDYRIKIHVFDYFKNIFVAIFLFIPMQVDTWSAGI